MIRLFKNMVRPVTALCCVGLLTCAFPTVVFAVDELRTPAEVIEIDRELDGTYIELQGEAIGEALRADSTHVWVNVLGGGMAVGVYVPEETAEAIDVYGDHRHDGDTVWVGGTVNVACDQHAGEFDVHAVNLEVVAHGNARETPIQPWKAIVGVVGIALFFGEWRLYNYLKERSLA